MLDTPLSYLGNSISTITSGHVSYVRLRAFLDSEEINLDNVERHPNAGLSENAYEVNNGTFGWYSPEAIKKLEEKREKEANDTMKNKTDVPEAAQKEEMIAVDEKSGVAGSDAISDSTVDSIKEKNDESACDTLGPFLRNVSFTIKRGSLTAIIGRVGEGKSSLVGALLGEMYKYSGSVSPMALLHMLPSQLGSSTTPSVTTSYLAASTTKSGIFKSSMPAPWFLTSRCSSW